jgi:uncharacterized protein
MQYFGTYIITALALVFVLEGLLYAFFPEAIRKMMAFALTLPPTHMRKIGLIMAATGFCFLWLLNALQTH